VGITFWLENLLPAHMALALVDWYVGLSTVVSTMSLVRWGAEHLGFMGINHSRSTATPHGAALKWPCHSCIAL
jgi:hypothetical protein